MRIIGGSARGKSLATFTGREIRPTPDRVREALFSILFSRFGSLEGLRVLDLFSGSGAMALEALSRGAERAVLVDEGNQAAELILQNIRGCRFEERALFLRSEVLGALPSLTARGPFDLVFLDPPYGRDLVPETIRVIARNGLLATGGVLSAEAGAGEVIPESISGLMRFDHRRYGTSAIHLFAHPESEDPSA